MIYLIDYALQLKMFLVKSEFSLCPPVLILFHKKLQYDCQPKHTDITGVIR